MCVDNVAGNISSSTLSLPDVTDIKPVDELISCSVTHHAQDLNVERGREEQQETGSGYHGAYELSEPDAETVRHCSGSCKAHHTMAFDGV